MNEILPVDVVAAAILTLASLRGFFLGLIREAFSIAALGGAYISVRLFTEPATAWLETSGTGVGPTLAPWIAGAGVAILSIAVVVFAGRLLRRGARWAGLGWADRAGGGVLGFAEGALVVAIVLSLGSTVLGRDHAALSNSASLRALEQLEQYAERAPADLSEIDVAAPGP